MLLRRSLLYFPHLSSGENLGGKHGAVVLSQEEHLLLMVYLSHRVHLKREVFIYITGLSLESSMAAVLFYIIDCLFCTFRKRIFSDLVVWSFY